MFANVKFSAPEPINLKRNGVIDEADLLISWNQKRNESSDRIFCLHHYKDTDKKKNPKSKVKWHELIAKKDTTVDVLMMKSELLLIF